MTLVYYNYFNKLYRILVVVFITFFTANNSFPSTIYLDNLQNRTKVILLEKNTVKATEKSGKIIEKNILTQKMLSSEDTRYIILHDFDLCESEIAVPEGCILDFQGGSFNNGTLKLLESLIIADPIQIFNNLKITGNCLNSQSFIEWFGIVKNKDNTDSFNKAIESFSSAKIVTKGNIIVNGTVRLNGKKHIHLGDGVILRKEANGNIPMFHIESSHNSITGDSKTSELRSSIATPFGIIAIADYADYICKKGTFFNKINNISLYGKNSEKVQSYALYLKGSYLTVGRYFNSFTNLLISTFNIGIGMHGDFNANYFRDITFYNVATAKDNETKTPYHTTDAAILLSSIEKENEVLACWENQFNQMFHSNSSGATTLYLKDKVVYNIIEFISESGGNSYFLKQVGGEVRANTITGVSVNQLYLKHEDSDFYIKNRIDIGSEVSFDRGHVGNFLNIRKSLNIGNSTHTETTSITPYKLSKTITKEALKDGKFYNLFTYDTGNTLYGIHKIIINLRSSGNNKYNSYGEMKFTIAKQENSTLILEAKSKDLNIADVVEPIIDGNLVSFVFRFTNQGVASWINNIRSNITIYAPSIIKESNIIVDNSNNEYTGKKNIINISNLCTPKNRPYKPTIGQICFDTILSKPIWWTGSKWVDANGTEI